MMEVVAVSRGVPKKMVINGLEIESSIVHEPLDYIDIDAAGIDGNRTAVHDGPVYVFFEEHYDYWSKELSVDRADWGPCHWGENITFRSRADDGSAPAKPTTEWDMHLGDVWQVGPVKLQVCGARIPCFKLAWRCGQPDTWLRTLSDVGFVGAYMRLLPSTSGLAGGRIHPGDRARLVHASGDLMDMASVCRIGFGTQLTTRDTLNLLAHHDTLLGLNRFLLAQKLHAMDDKSLLGRGAWDGWRRLRVVRVVAHRHRALKSFYLEADDVEDVKDVEEAKVIEDGQNNQDDPKGRHTGNRDKPMPPNHPQPPELAYYEPGQFLTVRLPSGTIRCWSISDYPENVLDTGVRRYRLTIRRQADASRWMHDHAVPGTRLDVMPPAGRFVLDRTPHIMPRQIYISAGIGCTPFLAMLKVHARHPAMVNTPGVWIHVSAHGRRDLPFTREWDAIYTDHRFLRRAFFATREGPPADAAAAAEPIDITGATDVDISGRPTLEHVRQLIGTSFIANPFGIGTLEVPPIMSCIYICGSPAFDADMRSHLAALSFPDTLVHTESFAPSVDGAGPGTDDIPGKATVTFAASNRTANWTRDKPISLLELAESVGLTPRYGCREGACGSCAAKLTCGRVQGGVTIDGSVLLCQAVPATEEVTINV